MYDKKLIHFLSLKWNFNWHFSLSMCMSVCHICPSVTFWRHSSKSVAASFVLRGGYFLVNYMQHDHYHFCWFQPEFWFFIKCPCHLPRQNVFCPRQNLICPGQKFFVWDKIFCPWLKSSFLLHISPRKLLFLMKQSIFAQKKSFLVTYVRQKWTF